MTTETEQLLNNEYFILWCLASTKASDEYWKQWIKKHPEQLVHIEEARRIIFSIRLNDYKMSHDETNRLRLRISKDLKKKKKD